MTKCFAIPPSYQLSDVGNKKQCISLVKLYKSLPRGYPLTGLYQKRSGQLTGPVSVHGNYSDDMPDIQMPWKQIKYVFYSSHKPMSRCKLGASENCTPKYSEIHFYHLYCKINVCLFWKYLVIAKWITTMLRFLLSTNFNVEYHFAYSDHLNTKLGSYSNGQNLFRCYMVWFYHLKTGPVFKWSTHLKPNSKSLFSHV
jgi:hypothetical protein